MTTNPSIQDFTTPSGKTTIRAIVGADGEPWFIAKDVCDVLGTRTDDIRSMLDEDEVATINPDTIGVAGGRSPLIISESGFYSLVLRSRKPVAKRFKAWVTKTVLPSIRKHGMYATPDMVDRMLANPEFGIKALKALKAEQEKNAALEGEIEEKRPMVEYAEKTTDGMELFLLTNAARYFGIPRAQFTDFLVGIKFLESGYCYGRPRFLPTERTIDDGLAIPPKGRDIYRITAAGMEYIRHQFDSQEEEL